MYTPSDGGSSPALEGILPPYMYGSSALCTVLHCALVYSALVYSALVYSALV